MALTVFQPTALHKWGEVTDNLLSQRPSTRASAHHVPSCQTPVSTSKINAHPTEKMTVTNWKLWRMDFDPAQHQGGVKGRSTDEEAR
jgi:hypothetical protein